MKKYRRAIALFLAIGLMVLIPSGMGVSASGNTVEAKMSENIAQVLSMTGIEREEYSDQLQQMERELFQIHKNRQQMQRHALMSLDIQPMNRALAHSII